MTEDEARRQLREILDRLRATNSWLLRPQWLGATPGGRRHGNSWVFWYTDPKEQHVVETVLVRDDDGQAFVVFGAIAKIYFFDGGLERLGLPTSHERWLGSGPGRYQTFDEGYIVWDQLRDVSYLRLSGPDFRPQRCYTIVAFFDLRGFTGWSEDQDVAAVDQLMARLEHLFNDAFCEPWCASLFVKGTGDGLMVVSEAAGFGLQGGKNIEGAAPGHASAFVAACERFVSAARHVVPARLALGGAIDCGELERVFLFGQRDYLGLAANNTAKLQQLAWDELCISHTFRDLLATDSPESARRAAAAKALGGDKFRLPVE